MTVMRNKKNKHVLQIVCEVFVQSKIALLVVFYK